MDGLSTESKASKSEIPSNDQPKCCNIDHQLNNRKTEKVLLIKSLIGIDIDFKPLWTNPSQK